MLRYMVELRILTPTRNKTASTGGSTRYSTSDDTIVIKIFKDFAVVSTTISGRNSGQFAEPTNGKYYSNIRPQKKRDLLLESFERQQVPRITSARRA